jgi:hypothetical protein
MRRLRVLAWFAPFLLVAALAVSGAHVHKGASASDETGCVACTLAHAAAAPADAAPAPSAPELTREVRAESPHEAPAVPCCSIPSSRAPPLG